MTFNINDFLTYANTGTAPTVYSRQKAVRKAQPRRTSPAAVVAPAVPLAAALPITSVIPTAPAITAPAVLPAAQPTLILVMYSERSFAIFGETKPVQKQLEALHGKFNRFLKRDGAATPGYIFSITRLDAVRKALNL